MPQQLIFLDQNMWIKLAQMHFHPQAHAPLHALMAKLTAAVDAGKIILPLSANHFVETLKVEDIERRRKLAKVMVAFSKGWMLAPEHAVVPLQLHNALSRTFNFDDEYEIKFLDKGIHFAFGITEDVTGHFNFRHSRALQNPPLNS
jgi:hypothetical protein